MVIRPSKASRRTSTSGRFRRIPAASGRLGRATAGIRRIRSPTVIAIIVTDNVIKDGPNIGGNIKQIVLVDRDAALGDRYSGNPGHQGWGKITEILCGPGTPPVPPI